MTAFTDEELRRAFLIWLANYVGKQDEEGLGPFLDEQMKPFAPGHRGWLRKARVGLFLSPEAVAKKLKVSRIAYSKYEDGEEKGTITLATLARAAEAMECELVYAIRPKSKRYFSQVIWVKLLPESLRHPWVKNCDQKRRGEALAYVLNKYTNDPEFRRQQGWSQRANS